MRPPYDPYAAKPDTVRTYADTIITKATAVQGIDTESLKQKARAAENITGELADKLDEPFKTIGKDADQIALVSAFVSGTLYTWASAISTFNSGVETLNTEWSNRSSGPAGGLSPAAIEEALVKDLNRRWRGLDATLDTAADDLKTELNAGPDKTSVLEYFASGALPESAFPLLSTVGIDPKKAKSVLADLRTFLAESKNGGVSKERMEAWFNMLETVKGMDPNAASVILGALSDKELKALHDEIGGIPENHMNSATDFYSFVLAGATREQVDHLKDLWDLNPAGKDDWGPRDAGVSLFYPPYVVPGENGGTAIGAEQGSVDDCWMLAKLNAIVTADPDWPMEHVRDNNNGTVSVKFYDGDGKPYWVTVTDEVSDSAAYNDGGPNESSWAIYYEKAMAADDHSPGGLVGGPGYDGLTAGFSDSADEYMTGKESDTVKFTGLDLFADPYEAAVEAHDNGEGVVAGNWGNDGMPWADEDDDLKQWHVYYVKDILPNGDVLLGNPWGEEDVTMSPGDFNTYLEDVSVVKQ